MKKFLMITSLVLLAFGCGGEEAPPVEDEAADTAEEQPDNNAAESAVPINEDPEPVEEVVLYPEGTLDPMAVSEGDLVSARALNEAYFAWDGMEVTLFGYPDIWYGDTAVVEDELELVMDPESNDELVTANFEPPSDHVVRRGEMVYVSGLVGRGWYGPELDAAMIVEAPEIPAAEEFSPWAYGGEPIAVDVFTELYNTWNGREVIVEGHYHSTTTSTLSSGVIVRVDLAAADDHYAKMVGCEMAEEIPQEISDAMADNREGLQIRGTIVDESFGMVGLENCVIVNR